MINIKGDLSDTYEDVTVWRRNVKRVVTCYPSCCVHVDALHGGNEDVRGLDDGS